MGEVRTVERSSTGGAALELLVHGVGGATPEKMLNDPRTVRITGDETAAVYRRAGDADADAPAADANAPSGDHHGRPVPEAYVWSNLTSGNGTRALWLLLLPFMVVNLAHWMRPAAREGTRAVRLYGLLVRLAGLSLTVLLVAAACEVALDLTAWQCAGTRACAARHSWLGFLSPSGSHGGWWSPPGRRLALAALVPTALTGLLWYLSHRTWRAYESQEPLDRGPEPEHGPAHTALSRPGFWYGRRLVARLRAAHTAAGLFTVAAAVGTAAAREDHRPGGPAVLDALGRLLEVSLAAGALAVVWVVCRRGRSENRLDRTLDAHLVHRLPLTALALLALTLVYAAWSRPHWHSSGRLAGDTAFGALALAQGALVLGLATVARSLHRSPKDGTGRGRSTVPAVPPQGGAADSSVPPAARPAPAVPCADGTDAPDGLAGAVPGPARPSAGRSAEAASADGERSALRGLGGPAVVMLACALGGVMSGGVAQRVSDWLDGTGTSLDGPPVLLTWQASMIPVLLVVLAVLCALLGRRTWLLTRAERAAVVREYRADPGDPARTGRIARTRSMATLTDRAPLLVAVTATSTLLLGAGALVGAFASGRTPVRATAAAGPFVQGAAQAAQALGSWLIGLGFILFVTWGRRAYKDASARRTIGILWDVGTFWPRAAHPFAPPCYAERAVPDLTWRMTGWTRATGGRLVISGHSQGSVLAAAAAWQLKPSDRKRVALLTYGSPIERLYGRWFPAHFGPAALAALHRDIDCWRNLYRLTDPIGGPVRLTGDDCGPEVDRAPLADPLAYGRTAEHPLPAPVLGHSDYQADPAFAEERARLLARLSPELPGQRGQRG
ncbi:hypothetical protein [Streptomyces griseoruber]|uniref:Integral membrane protein n=1 Tax=Streptomyces griseoruber TaxID=1943 RepID=A0A101SPQ3_9ACTN|nr:hypothetical protein [Streptomyces griseoruber]KUN77982.1 hypothetical protein AQJ64_32800 [Streptomyces griseoruber]